MNRINNIDKVIVLRGEIQALINKLYEKGIPQNIVGTLDDDLTKVYNDYEGLKQLKEFVLHLYHTLLNASTV